MSIEEKLGCEVEWGEETFPILIYFPYLTVRNANGMSHNIRDLYIKIDEDGDIYGMRTSLTKAEIFARYSQSHLTGLNASRDGQTIRIRPYWGDFCLGESEIRTYLHTIKEGKIDIRGEFFNLFLISLKNYLEWESLSGGPHVRMSTIGVNSLQTVSRPVDLSQEILDRIVPLVINHSKTRIRNGKLEIVILDSVVPLLKNLLNDSYFCYNINGTESSLTNTDYTFRFDNDESFYFKKKELEFKVIDFEMKEIEYPISLTSKLKKQLENEIRARIFKANSYTISQGRSRNSSQSDNSRIHLEEDKLALC